MEPLFGNIGITDLWFDRPSMAPFFRISYGLRPKTTTRPKTSAEVGIYKRKKTRFRPRKRPRKKIDNDQEKKRKKTRSRPRKYDS